MLELPTLDDIHAERARRPPVLDNSPDVLMRVVDVLVRAHAVPEDVAAVLRGAGIEVSADALGEHENAAEEEALSP